MDLNTATLPELVAEHDRVTDAAEAIVKAADGKPFSDGQRTELGAMTKSLGELRKAMEVRQGDHSLEDGVRAARAEAEARRAAGRPALTPADGGGSRDGTEDVPLELLTPGEAYGRSEAHASWMKLFPEGGPPTAMTFQGAPQSVRNMRALLGIETSTEKFVRKMRGQRSLINVGGPTGDYPNPGAAGPFVYPQFLGLLEPGLVRPLVIRQLLTTMPITTDTVEYVKESSRIRNAQNVMEATALSGTSGTKPEGGLTFTVVTDVVRTIAEWVPATKRVLSDAPQLRAYIDEYLTNDLAQHLEDQVMSGNGVGENFLGILNTSGIQTAGPPGTGKNMLDALRTAKRLVRIGARTNSTAIVLNPADAEAIETLKDSQGRYYGVGPFGPGIMPPSIWGVPTVESEAIPANTALVGDFTRAILFDREQTNISVGTVNDDFIRNIIRILAEMRAGFGVIRPAAFVAVTLS